ncbi:MAG: TM2 domain-containing protein [Bacilli bacterium]
MIKKANYVTNTSDKSKKVALILCACGGFFGIHLFYVGKIGKGLLYMCTAGLFFLGWIFDLIKISIGTFTDGAGVPLRK